MAGKKMKLNDGNELLDYHTLSSIKEIELGSLDVEALQKEVIKIVEQEELKKEELKKEVANGLKNVPVEELSMPLNNPAGAIGHLVEPKHSVILELPSLLRKISPPPSPKKEFLVTRPQRITNKQGSYDFIF